MYSDDFKRDKANAMCTGVISASDLYRVARFYGIISPVKVSRPSDCLNYALFNDAATAADLYQTMRACGLVRVLKSDTMPTFEDVHMASVLGMSSSEVYRFYKSGLSTVNAYNSYENAWNTYIFYSYTMYGKQWHKKPLLLDTTAFLNRAILRTNESTCILSSLQVYNYYKVRNIVKDAPKANYRAPRKTEDKPRAIMRGLVHTDYYITKDDKEQQKHRLKRDKFNDTQGTINAVVDVLPTLFKKQIKQSDKARHTIHVYNERCLNLIRNIISNVNGSAKNKTGRKINDARIVYAKNGNIKVALYAIIFEQNKPAKVIYFNIKSDIAYTRNYTFKGNKVKHNDMVSLSKVKDRDIMIYADKL